MLKKLLIGSVTATLITASAGVASAEKLKIALIEGLSGPFAATGQSAARELRFAVKKYLGDKAEPWWSSRGNPIDEDITWFVVSINALQNGIHPTTRGFDRNPEDSYQWLRESRDTENLFGAAPSPDYRIGTSLFIYMLQ